MTFEEFAESYSMNAECVAIDRRTDRDTDEWAKTAVHFLCVLKHGDKPIWTGEYSKGFGHAENWAQKNKSKFFGYSNVRDALRKPLPFGKQWLPDSEYVQTVRKVAAKHIAPNAAELLESLQSDAANSDEKFEEWAVGYGYDADSRKAYSIWEACNLIRRQLRDGLGEKLFSELLECEE